MRSERQSPQRTVSAKAQWRSTFPAPAPDSEQDALLTRIKSVLPETPRLPEKMRRVSDQWQRPSKQAEYVQAFLSSDDFKDAGDQPIVIKEAFVAFVKRNEQWETVFYESDFKRDTTTRISKTLLELGVTWESFTRRAASSTARSASSELKFDKRKIDKAWKELSDLAKQETAQKANQGPMLGRGAYSEVAVVDEQSVYSQPVAKEAEVMIVAKSGDTTPKPRGVTVLNSIEGLDVRFLSPAQAQTEKGEEKRQRADCDLFKYCRNNPGKHNLLQVKQLFAQLILGLEELHKRDLVHRDIKPANILLFNQTGGGLPRLAYGDLDEVCPATSALDYAQGSPVVRVVGTPGYLPAEWNKSFAKLEQAKDLDTSENIYKLLSERFQKKDPMWLDRYALGRVLFDMQVLLPKKPQPGSDYLALCNDLMSESGAIKGIDDIKEHAFFADVNFDVLKQTYRADSTVSLGGSYSQPVVPKTGDMFGLLPPKLQDLKILTDNLNNKLSTAVPPIAEAEFSAILQQYTQVVLQIGRIYLDPDYQAYTQSGQLTAIVNVYTPTLLKLASTKDQQTFIQDLENFLNLPGLQTLRDASQNSTGLTDLMHAAQNLRNQLQDFALKNPALASLLREEQGDNSLWCDLTLYLKAGECEREFSGIFGAWVGCVKASELTCEDLQQAATRVRECVQRMKPQLSKDTLTPGVWRAVSQELANRVAAFDALSPIYNELAVIAMKLSPETTVENPAELRRRIEICIDNIQAMIDSPPSEVCRGLGEYQGLLTPQLVKLEKLKNKLDIIHEFERLYTLAVQQLNTVSPVNDVNHAQNALDAAQKCLDYFNDNIEEPLFTYDERAMANVKADDIKKKINGDEFQQRYRQMRANNAKTAAWKNIENKEARANWLAKFKSRFWRFFRIFTRRNVAAKDRVDLLADNLLLPMSGTETETQVEFSAFKGSFVALVERLAVEYTEVSGGSAQKKEKKAKSFEQLSTKILDAENLDQIKTTVWEKRQSLSKSRPHQIFFGNRVRASMLTELHHSLGSFEQEAVTEESPADSLMKAETQRVCRRQH